MVLTLTRQSTVTSRLVAPEEGSDKELPSVSQSMDAVPSSTVAHNGSSRDNILGAPVDMLRRISLFGFQNVDHNEESNHVELALTEGKPSMQEMFEVDSKNGESKTGQCASAFLEEAEEESGGIENDNVDIDEIAPTNRCSTDRVRDLFHSVELQALDSIKNPTGANDIVRLKLVKPYDS